MLLPRLHTLSVVKMVIVGTIFYITVIAKYASNQLDTRVTSGTTQCAYLNQSLRGAMDIDLDRTPPDPDSLERLGKELGVRSGGSWSSHLCPPSSDADEKGDADEKDVHQQRIAIIIPYRDRWKHLSLLLSHLHPFLQRQQSAYTVFVVEQAYNETFNKGLIMNACFAEIMKMEERWDCVIFHDVDMVPQNDHNLYQCGQQPRHLSPALDNMRYTLMYPNLVGGVLALTPHHMSTVNGYSNLYWGWGAEDDDMSLRILNSNYNIERPPSYIGRYKMASHPKREMAKNRITLLSEWKRFKTDGINSLHKFPLKVVKKTLYALYTHILVDIGPKPAQPQISDSNANSPRWFSDWLFLWKQNI